MLAPSDRSLKLRQLLRDAEEEESHNGTLPRKKKEKKKKMPPLRLKFRSKM